MTATSRVLPRMREIKFGPLDIGFDSRVLRPRRWTALQAIRAAELLQSLPDAPVLELCCGAGQIGLLATYENGRRLVQVDSSTAACAWARVNADRAGQPVDVREGDLEQVLAPEERFAMILADPPWVPQPRVSLFPEDPPSAIDGGRDGLALARRCLRVIAQHLLERGAAILQLGSEDQVALLQDELGSLGLGVTDVETVRGRGVLVCLRRS